MRLLGLHGDITLDTLNTMKHGFVLDGNFLQFEGDILPFLVKFKKNK